MQVHHGVHPTKTELMSNIYGSQLEHPPCPSHTDRMYLSCLWFPVGAPSLSIPHRQNLCLIYMVPSWSTLLVHPTQTELTLMSIVPSWSTLLVHPTQTELTLMSIIPSWNTLLVHPTQTEHTCHVYDSFGIQPDGAALIVLSIPHRQNVPVMSIVPMGSNQMGQPSLSCPSHTDRTYLSCLWFLWDPTRWGSPHCLVHPTQTERTCHVYGSLLEHLPCPPHISIICTRVLAHIVLSTGNMRRNGIQHHPPPDYPFLSSFIVLFN